MTGRVVKLQRRCPECRTTGIKERTTTSPRFRCNSGHTFDAAIEEQAECRLYQARFGDSQKVLAKPVSVSALRLVIVRYSEQHAISELNRVGMIGPEFALLTEMLDRLDTVPAYPQADDSTDVAAPYMPTGLDTRTVSMKNVRARRGQPAFRLALRQRYGDRCQVSGCTLLELLEAAHISPYRSDDDQHPGNGLLLRADLHTLFDLDLLGHPETLEIHLHPTLSCDPHYSSFEYARLSCGPDRPSRPALDSKWPSSRAAGPRAQRPSW
jgi:putative restriction endonuclease